MSIPHLNEKINSYTKLQVVKPYIALNEETLFLKDIRNWESVKI